MLGIKIEIVRFISDDQPGFVECCFIDAWNNKHIIHEKVPVVTHLCLDESSDYPQTGIIACELLKNWIDNKGRALSTVSIDKPWSVETIEGVVEFDIIEEQLNR